MSSVRAILLCATLLALSGTAEADRARIKVAVIPGIAVNVDASRVDALGQDLASALAAELDVDAVGGLEVRRRLPVEGIPPDCIAKPACIADVAKRTAASQLLFIVVVDTGSGGSIQIDSTWIDAGTGESASRPAIDLAPGAEPRSRFQSAASALLPDAPVRQKTKGVGKMTPAVPRHLSRTAKITAGVAVAGLGVGVGFGLAARSKFKACDVAYPAPECQTDAYKDSIFRRALLADVGYALAIGGAIATVTLFMTSAKESTLVVEPSPQGVAVSAIGRF